MSTAWEFTNHFVRNEYFYKDNYEVNGEIACKIRCTNLTNISTFNTSTAYVGMCWHASDGKYFVK